MHALRMTFVVEAKLFLREPAAVFFTFLLPLMLLVLNGGSNQPRAELGGAGLVDMLVPGYIAMVMATAGLMSLPETLAGYRERGILRRLRLTPVPVWTLLAAHAGVQLAIAALGTAILITSGMAAAGLNAAASWPAVGLAVVVSALSTLAIGFLLASVLPTTRTTQAVAAALYFPMIFLSGATFPRDALPDIAQRVGDFLPMTYAVRALRMAWVDGVVARGPLTLLCAVAAAAVVICTRTFRWE